MDIAYIMIYCTCPDHSSALNLAEQLVKARLAACVNIIDRINSIYHWQGKTEHATEYLLMIKTKFERWHDIKATIERNHPYELPELIAVPIVAGLPEYLNWLQESTQP